MKVIIAGSRTIRRYTEVAEAMKDCGFDVTEVVSGGAVGIDQLAERWAWRHEVPLTVMRPQYPQFLWKGDAAYRRAPLVRNEKMGAYADALVAVWDGRSRGTAHMMQVMKRLGKPVFLRKVED